MRPQEIIAKKRDGGRLNDAEIRAFVEGVTDGSWADYQITALIMAMFLNELDFDEQSLITHAMLHSGEILDFSDLGVPVADKHSTGGVGDKTSLLIAPIAAACGLAVPMISGRGLGHTGGTLDKLESIPGYSVNLPVEDFKRIVKECGYAMSGQTADIAPADKKIYGLRDATATVPTIPLIVASIMSKKLAEGLDVLVLDVKTGNGAFMRDLEQAQQLAREMVRTGDSFGVKTRALITDMNRPLGRYVGNAVEVYECLKILRGEADNLMLPTRNLASELASHLLLLAGIDESKEAAYQRVLTAVENGSALERFRTNVETQGGDPSICDDPDRLLTRGLIEKSIVASADGYISRIDTLTVGKVTNEIGGGRTKAEDEIDSAVGFRCEKTIGDEVTAGETIAVVSCRDVGAAEKAVEKLTAAYTIKPEPPEKSELVIEVVR
ncbi:MAG: thymidine phosphorylase [Acidobacteria bacterium]|nr:MAG: thymidine phosphorylase [Acidobacteriota bacterium]REK02236.1 MAG: thymidine phosphorylase [Acidobacteriota bacterium]REK13961.1 MAG: thymidine phosphorylase [Acidobacteriota bacterium]REK41956.1 MAG: thymidine phosphorylase [Acidobacteriota bacterium]